MRPLFLVGMLALAALPAAGQGRREMARLRQAVVADSVDAESYYHLGLGLWSGHRFAGADSAFRRAIHFAPWHAGAQLALALLPMGRGERYLFDLRLRITPDSLQAIADESNTHLRSAFLADPLVDLAPFRLVPVDALLSGGGAAACLPGHCLHPGGVPDWLRALRRGVRWLAAGHPDSAYTVFDRAATARRPDETFPDEFIWYYALAADRTAHPDVAADGYRELAERTVRRETNDRAMGPDGVAPDFFLVLYGMASDRAGHRELAREAYRAALVMNLSNRYAHSRLADLAESDGQTELALSERQAAITAAPDEGRPYLDLGATLLRAGRPVDAREAFLEGAQRLPWDPGTQLSLFQAAMALGDRATAQRALAALDLFTPRRDRDQVVAAHQRFDGPAAP